MHLRLLSHRLRLLLPEVLSRRPVDYILLALITLANACTDPEASNQYCRNHQSLTEATGQRPILIIGDSISIGYMPTIRAALQANYDVVHNPCNAMSSNWTRKQIDYWLNSRPSFESITWNNGLWDIGISDARYEENLHEIAAKIKSKTKHPLFILTTQILPGTPNKSDSSVIAKNEVAIAVMKAEGIPVLDLYAVSLGLAAEHLSPTDLHYTPAGYAVLGAALLDELNKRYGIR